MARSHRRAGALPGDSDDERLRKAVLTLRFLQLAMMLVLLFLLQWSRGGFEASSAVMLWAVTAPLGA